MEEIRGRTDTESGNVMGVGRGVLNATVNVKWVY